jgi:MoxR-like ATPase
VIKGAIKPDRRKLWRPFLAVAVALMSMIVVVVQPVMQMSPALSVAFLVSTSQQLTTTKRSATMNLPQDISMIPLGRLNGALVKLGIAPASLKSDAVSAIYHQIQSGSITLDEVKNSAVFDINANQASPDFNHQAVALLSSSVSSLQDSTDANTSALLDIADEHKLIDARLTTFAESLIRNAQLADSKIHGLSEQIKSATHTDISTAVNQAVSEAFGAFRQVNSVEVIEEIAQTLPTTQLARAGDLFPDTSYRAGDDVIDFSDMIVMTWGDPEAPAIVDDYVFNPEPLHQALIALDDPLPENTWLAGERGTGKTEFVSQISARLGRKLYRVNFDEAMERADFIGANVIENGSVVWKAGVLTQAIQHQGSIILLDEVGFARAQSLAVLHSVCERSPHRAVVIAETGGRIPVSPFVAFFACDNSNGHGDTSGNFAGVREQNTAFLDRFGFSLRFEYLPAIQEAGLITTRSGLAFHKAEVLVRFANIAREKAQAGLLTQPPSLRQLFAWARAIQKGLPVRVAYQNTIVNKFPADVQAELDAIYTLQIQEGVFK